MEAEFQSTFEFLLSDTVSVDVTAGEVTPVVGNMFAVVGIPNRIYLPILAKQ